MHKRTLFVFLFTTFLSFHVHHALRLYDGSGLRTGDAPAQEANAEFAVLISGQQFRFMYKDAFQKAPGNLKGVVCGHATSSKCSFDVFIVLAQTETEPYVNFNTIERAQEMARNPSFMIDTSKELPDDRFYMEEVLGATCLEKPPYELSEVAIRSFFADQGANHVEINFLSVGDFDKRIRERDELVEKMGHNALNMTHEDWQAATKKLPEWWRYKTNGNMMFLRHLAHASALAAESSFKKHYTHFLYLREDNAFVEPVHSMWDAIQHMPSNMVMVDKYCPWGPGRSDKIYLAGPEGARVLFSASLEEHAMDISRWVNRALRQKKPLQSEYWLYYLMTSSGLNVQNGDFHRVDLRYIKGSTESPCVPRQYFSCTAHPGEIYPQCNC